jgi:phosphatidylglycerophosphate synthase
MPKIHLAPLLSLAAGSLGLFALDRLSSLSTAGWAAGFLYLVVSDAFLARGLHRSGLSEVGWGNWATTARSTLVALVTALVATSFTEPVSVALLTVLAGVALGLDAVDGWLARRTHSVSALGAQFDMEVDAFLLLVLSAYVAPQLGSWVLVIGLLRYAFVVAGWLLPWLRATLPPRYWRKVVTAVAGIALVGAASGILPTWAAALAVLFALGLLLESFGRDVLWLVTRRRGTTARADANTETKGITR